MAEVILSNGAVALVDDADFAAVSKRKWFVGGRGYACTRICGRTVSMHRFLLEPPPELVVDHANGNRLDNRRQNIRVCTARENGRNKRKAEGYKGTTRRGRYWRSLIMVDGKQHTIGMFETEIEAAIAYDRCASEVFGEFASLNFSPDRDWLLPYAVKPTARSADWKRKTPPLDPRNPDLVQFLKSEDR